MFNHFHSRPAPAVRVSGRSTASVLWLMILLVFLPIATAHVLARIAEPSALPAAAGTAEREVPRAG